MHKKFFSTFLLAGLLAFFAARVQAQSAQQPGQIVAQRVTGSVLLVNLADNSAVALQTGDTLKQGYAVRTTKEASAVLVFSNGATICISQESELSIDQFLQDPFSEPVRLADLKEEPTTSTTKLKLTYGEVVGNVRHLHEDKGSSFDVQTPVGAAGIRGTKFKVTYMPGDNGKAFFSISTVEGTVIFTGVANQIVPVPGGVQITVDVTLDANGNVRLDIRHGRLPPGVADAINELLQQAADAIIQWQDGSGSPPPTSPPPRTTPGDGRH